MTLTLREADRHRQDVVGLETTLTTVQKDRTLTKYENQILREFMSQTECDKALGLLLRRFIPNAEQGFAAFIQFESQGPVITHNRGLSESSCARLKIDAPFQEQLKQCKSLVLE